MTARAGSTSAFTDIVTGFDPDQPDLESFLQF